MAKLKLREDNPATANNAHAMVAKDGEIVEFHKECRCEGQVEVWLNRLLTTMRDSLRYFFSYKVDFKGSLDLIPSPSTSVKILIMGGKVSLSCKVKTLLGIVNKLLKKMFFDITQQCFALLPQADFPANNLNFH